MTTNKQTIKKHQCRRKLFSIRGAGHRRKRSGERGKEAGKKEGRKKEERKKGGREGGRKRSRKEEERKGRRKELSGNLTSMACMVLQKPKCSQVT